MKRQKTQTTKKKLYNKTKLSAVLISIFFGLFGFLYTYRKSKLQWWWSFGIFIFALFMNDDILSNLMGVGILIWVIVDRATRPSDYYKYL